jgi:hypothetical protein
MAQNPQYQSIRSGGIQPPNMQPMTVNQIQGLPRVGLNDVLMNKQFGYQTDPMVARNTAMKVAEQRALIDPKVEEQKALAQPRVDEQVQKDIASQNLKRSIYGKDLQNFMAIDNILHESRGSGTQRIKAGLDMSVQGFKQDSTLGRAVAAHDAASKRLRVQLVRAAGDVGPINIVEQKAAELLVPSRYDDKGTAEIKRAYLKDFAQAINSEEPSHVKSVIERFMKEDSYKSNVVIVNDPISGKTLHLPKDKVDDYNKYLKSKGL